MIFEEILLELKKGVKIICKGWSGFEFYVVFVFDDEFDGCLVMFYLLIKISDEGFFSFVFIVCDILVDDWVIVE